MNTTTISKKVWSPNSPWGRDNAVFSRGMALSLCAGGKARMVPMADGYASINGQPAAMWSEAWLRAKYMKMGMPGKGVDKALVLVFQGAFGEAVKRVMTEEAQDRAEDRAFDEMVDVERGGKVFAQWKNRPTMKSKTPGGPSMNSQQALLRRRKS